MITPTGITVEDYTNAIKNGNITHARMTFASGKVLEDQDIESNGFVIRDVLNGDTNLLFGKAVMKELNISIINSSRLTGIKWTEEFQLEMGVDTTSDDVTTTNWVTVGYFQGQRPEKIHYVEVIQFTAYDRMQKFNILASELLKYLDSNYTWPITVNNIYQSCATMAGIPCDTISALIMSRTFQRDFMNFEGLTCRDVLALIAEANATYACITNDGSLTFKWYANQTTNIITADEEFSVETADIAEGMTYGDSESLTNEELEDYTYNDLGGWGIVYGIDGLDVKLTENDIGIHYGNTVGNLYQIIDNPFLVIQNSTDAETYIEPIWNKLHAFGGHLPVRVECIGNWLYQAGDIIRIVIRSDETPMYVPVYTHELHWNGHPTSVYECTGEIVRPAISNEAKQKLTQGAKFHEFKNDIDGLVSRVGNTEGDVSTLQQTADSLSLQVADKYDRVSGIDITGEGVTVTGAKKVEIKSGGSFEVDATNFKINSAEKKIEAGKWTFDDEGSSFSEETTVGSDTRIVDFTIGKTLAEIDTSHDVCGLYNTYQYTSSSSGNDYRPTIWLFINSVTENDSWGIPFRFYTYISGGELQKAVDIGIATYGGNLCKIFFGRIETINHLEKVYANKIFAEGSDANAHPVIGESNSRFYTGYFETINTIYESVYRISTRVPSGGSDTMIGTSASRFTYGYFGTVNATTVIQGSSKNIKHDIKPMQDIGERLDKLQLVTYVYNDDKNERKRFGLIHEDTIKVLPEICIGDESSKPEDKGINYMELVPMLLKEVQELRKRVTDLENRVSELEGNK